MFIVAQVKVHLIMPIFSKAISLFFIGIICISLPSFSGNTMSSKKKKICVNTSAEKAALHALQNNNVAYIRTALEAGLQPNTFITLGSGARVTLLHCALAQENAYEMATLLIAAGADITIPTQPFIFKQKISSYNYEYKHTFTPYDLLTLLCLECHNDFCFTYKQKNDYHNNPQLLQTALLLEKTAQSRNIKLTPFSTHGTHIRDAIPWNSNDTKNLFTSPLFKHIFIQHNTIPGSIYNFHFFITKIHTLNIAKNYHQELSNLINKVLEQGIFINQKYNQITILDYIDSCEIPENNPTVFYATEPILLHGGICQGHLTSKESEFLDPFVYLPPLLREDLSLCIKQLHYWQTTKTLPQLPRNETTAFYEMCILRAFYIGEHKKHSLEDTTQLIRHIITHIPEKTISSRFLIKLHCCLGYHLSDKTWHIYKALPLPVPTTLYKLLSTGKLSDILICCKNND